jgi:hypothetical protein
VQRRRSEVLLLCRGISRPPYMTKGRTRIPSIAATRAPNLSGFPSPNPSKSNSFSPPLRYPLDSLPAPCCFLFPPHHLSARYFCLSTAATYTKHSETA